MGPACETVRTISVIQPLISGGLIFVSALPKLLQDIVGKADRWVNDGKAGRIDPFTELYDVSYSYSARFLSALNLLAY